MMDEFHKPSSLILHDNIQFEHADAIYLVCLFYLKEYNQHIQDLKEEMEEATKSAEIIREEIQSFRNRCASSPTWLTVPS